MCCCMPQATSSSPTAPKASSLLPLKSRIRISGAFQCNVTRSCERVVSPLLLPSLLPPLTSLCSLLPATASHISWPHLFCLIWSVFCFGFYYFFVYCLLLYSFVFPFGQRISLSTAFRMHFSSLSISISLSATSGPPHRQLWLFFLTLFTFISAFLAFPFSSKSKKKHEKTDHEITYLFHFISHAFSFPTLSLIYHFLCSQISSVFSFFFRCSLELRLSTS